MTTLRLYNTLTKQKDDFAPLDAKNVRMYVCGPTVYDYAHIGNARPAIVFDVLYRLLKHLYPGEGAATDGSRVTYVRNITDIDDKINARAAERAATDKRNVPILQVLREITEGTYGVYTQDVTALGCLPPTHMPRATEYVPQMIAMIEKLIAAGYAYSAEGHVLFRVKKKADYGKLARRSLDDMLAGARIDVAPYKEDPMDFVLWKPSEVEQPGWQSPWGYGRPGWHLECSAMIEATFKFEDGGDTIDIHGGGIDLVFPHHENEIAQSESVHHGHPLARFWMHNGHLQVEGEKMSKSLGNFVTINELLKDWPGEVLRFNMLRTHYRQPMDWTVAGMTESYATLKSWRRALLEYDGAELIDPPSKGLVEILSDDLNTPEAITWLHKQFESSVGPHAKGVRQFGCDLNFLGLVWKRATDPEISKAYAKSEKGRQAVASLDKGASLNDVIRATLSPTLEVITDSIEARKAARARKDFKESDRIRDDLLAKGIVLKDGPTGTTWEVKR